MTFWRKTVAISAMVLLSIVVSVARGLPDTATAVAQTAADRASEVMFIDHDKLAAALAKTQEVAKGPGLRFLGAHRDGAGGVEAHENETDVFYIVDGEASLTIGGTLLGPKVAGPGEIQGSGISGGQIRQVVKGDVIVIPAGIPHRFNEVPKSISYLVVKVGKQ